MKNNEKEVSRDHLNRFQELNSEDRNIQKKWDDLEMDVRKQFSSWERDISKLEKEEVKSWKEWESMSNDFLEMDSKHDQEVEKALKKNAEIGDLIFRGKKSPSEMKGQHEHPKEIIRRMKREFMEENRVIIDAIKKKYYESLKIAEKRIDLTMRIGMRIDGNLQEKFHAHRKMMEKYEKAKRGISTPFFLGKYDRESLFKEIRIHEGKAVIHQMGIGRIRIESLKDLRILLLHCKTLNNFEGELIEAIEDLKRRGIDWKENYLLVKLYGGDSGRSGYSIMVFNKDVGKKSYQLPDVDHDPKVEKKRSIQMGDLNHE